MKRVEDYPLPKDVAGLVRIVGPLIIAVGGYIGFALAKDDPTLTTKKLIGGGITAAFVAWAAGGISSHLLHFDEQVSMYIGAVLGSQGPAGAYLLVNKVKRIFER